MHGHIRIETNQHFFPSVFVLLARLFIYSITNDIHVQKKRVQKLKAATVTLPNTTRLAQSKKITEEAEKN